MLPYQNNPPSFPVSPPSSVPNHQSVKTFSETENEFLVGATSLNSSEFDRDQYSREDILELCLDTWRYKLIIRRSLRSFRNAWLGHMAWDACSKMNGSETLLIQASDPILEIEKYADQ